MSPLTLDGVEALRARVGSELGVSSWHKVTQEEISRARMRATLTRCRAASRSP